MTNNERWKSAVLRHVTQRVRDNRTKQWPLARQDIEKLAAAYLAEHPDDDDESISGAWLKSVGFAWENTNNMILDVRVPVLWYPRLGIHLDANSSIVSMPHIQTRGDVRRLREALGVELEETK